MAHAAAEAHVAIEPWVDDQSALFAGIDLLVVPSEPVENTPRVILEAYSAGVPVLAYYAGGIPELVDDGRTGILVRPQTPEALAQSIREAVYAARPYVANSRGGPDTLA